MNNENKLYVLQAPMLYAVLGFAFLLSLHFSTKKIIRKLKISFVTLKKGMLEVMVNPLQPCVAFQYPLKTSENLKVF